jgi:hypothetical protein
MSFIPAVPDFSNSSLLTPAGNFSPQTCAMNNNLTHKEIATLIQTNASATPKLVRRQLPRARKARARLRQQNKVRAAAMRTN